MALRPEIVKELARGVEIIVGRLSGKLIRDLRDATPKDTGYHSSRWLVKAGGLPPSQATPRTRAGRLSAANFGPQNASIAAIAGYRLTQGAVNIANDGNYIAALNAGSSSKAPPLFVDKAVERSVINVSLAGTGLKR